MYKQNSEYKSIQKKLVAAIAMVLVACIMVVSSSYAWFTLSTAPEVTGITTSVGSNGNLEMALIDTTLDAIGTATSGSMDFPTINNFWGNLVNLSHEDYALNKISLSPARLVATPGVDAGEYVVNNTGYLQAPTYGVDGRIDQFRPVPYTGVYNKEENGFVANDTLTKLFGVRAIGTTSGLSAEEMVLMEAISAMNSTVTSVGRKASASLSQDAIDLANIMLNNKLKPTVYTHVSEEEFTQVKNAVANLVAIQNELKGAMDQAVVAVGAAQGDTVDATTITYGTTITANDTEGNAVTFTKLTAELQTALLAAYDVIYGTDGMNAKLTAANDAITEATSSKEDAGYPYAKVQTILTAVLDTTDMVLVGEDDTGASVEYYLGGTNAASQSQLLGVVVDSLTANEPVQIQIKDGIYKDIHDFIDDYYGSAKLTVDLTGTEYEGKFGSKNEISVNASLRVETDEPATGYYLPYFSAQLALLEVDGGSGDDATLITDAYGYVIDLAFKTNAVGSNLQLQTEAASRVAGDLTASVQGSGSYMKFKLAGGANGDPNYSVGQMQDLMDAIRVVLIDFTTGEIYGIAKLDMENAAVTEENGETYVTAYLYLYNYNIDGATGKLTVTTMKTDATTGNYDPTITALQQNIAIGISAMVYLDGDYVDNGDVAIRGDSMTGTLNLQFSSSEDLEPMDYTFTEDTGADEEDLPMPAITAATIDANGTLTFTHENAPTGVIYTLAIGESNTYTVNNGDTLSAEQLALLAGNTVGLVATADGYEAGAAQVTVEYNAGA